MGISENLPGSLENGVKLAARLAGLFHFQRNKASFLISLPHIAAIFNIHIEWKKTTDWTSVRGTV